MRVTGQTLERAVPCDVELHEVRCSNAWHRTQHECIDDGEQAGGHGDSERDRHDDSRGERRTPAQALSGDAGVAAEPVGETGGREVVIVLP
jgi:hypothetical protein